MASPGMVNHTERLEGCGLMDRTATALKIKRCCGETARLANNNILVPRGPEYANLLVEDSQNGSVTRVHCIWLHHLSPTV